MGHQHDVRRLSAGTGDPEHRFVRPPRGCHRGGALGVADRVRGRAVAEAAFRVTLWLGRRLGDLLHLALPSRRRTALENLAIAFPERSVSERRVLCRSAFEHLGMTLVEVGLALVCRPAVLARRISVDGLEHLEAATAASRPGGVLVLTAHFGNWELAGLVGPLYGVPMATVVRPLDSPLLDRLARRLRVSTGVEMIDKREAFRAVTDALRRRQLVAILLDQNASRHEGVFVPFFGRPASTSRGLALLSLRTGTPILPVFMHREPDGRHHLVIEPAIPSPSRGALGASIEELTAACASRIEATVRRWPEQWLWLHRRWRTRPVGETMRA